MKANPDLLRRLHGRRKLTHALVAVLRRHAAALLDATAVVTYQARGGSDNRLGSSPR
jgi:hypothetical protein